ncbi:AroM family protein [Pantoea sp. Mb-10]|uniref:AroM family protein n=1 Tax=unclassified Pantoea TaxID=2630326 RepID=UPI001E348005|nr:MULTISPECIES: AroM family protein [unclassified Pantoea]MCE0488975.1 AroM family protein [Pantoea sp. Mb-10]MCE0500722.1 AroM family protein [Pantoea sp. Pb-8]
MKKSLVTLTIGQAPRSDIMPLLQAHLPEDAVDHVGLLDGLTTDAIAQRYAPAPGEPVLVSRLLSGEQVRLAVPNVEQGLQDKIHALEQQGYDTILLLCTGEFGALTTQKALLLEPDRIIPPLINAIVQQHKVGIVVPVKEQVAEQANKWRSLHRAPCFAVASPYLAAQSELIDAGLSLQEQGADVVVLDCIGYHQKHRDFLQNMLGIPVLLSNVLVAKLAAELIL